MRRERLALLSIAIAAAFLFAGSAQAQKPMDLSGLWVRDDGGVVRFSQDAQKVRAVHVELAVPIRDVFGFRPGDDHMAGILEGRTLRGKMYVHLPVERKSRCPEQWARLTDIELTVSEDGNTIEGRWEWHQVRDKDCSITRREWQPRRYARLQSTPTAGPGHLSVVARGSHLMPLRLALILDASLKVLPLPVAEATLRFEMPEDKAIEALNRWAGRPLPISASAWNGGDLGLRLSGAAAAVRAACGKLGGERIEEGEARAFWSGIREHTDPFFRTEMPLWRLSVPSATPPLALQGAQMIEWGGALRWLATNADARTVREAARRAGGHATLFRGGDKSAGVFQPLEPGLAKIHCRLKASFDPEGIFNRGRMYSDF